MFTVVVSYFLNSGEESLAFRARRYSIATTPTSTAKMSLVNRGKSARLATRVEISLTCALQHETRTPALGKSVFRRSSRVKG